MSADETYLESFMESISTLPNELKRNLAHMKTLDVSCSKLVQELRDLEEEHLEHAYSIISQYEVKSDAQLQEEKEEKQKEQQNFMHQQKKHKLEEGKDVKSKNDANDENDEILGEGHVTEAKSEENKKYDVKDDSKSSRGNYLFSPKYGIPVKIKVAKYSSSSSSTSPTPPTTPKMETKTAFETDEETVLVVPTTEELSYQIQNTEHLLEIAKLRKSARQLTEEKVAVSKQTCSLLDSHIQRLDSDLEKFENLLKNTGQYQETIAGRNGGIAKPDDLAAIQVTPNSPDWILAKVITHDPNTQMYKLADEDIESNKTFTLPESQVVILGIGGLESTRKGDVIYAVYPDTTSFYQATVVQCPKKVAGGDSFVLVNFKDDGDENGITHDKAVLMKHIMRVPYGAMQ